MSVTNGAAGLLITALGDEPLAPLVLARQLDVASVICVGRPVVQWRVEPLLHMLTKEGRRARWKPTDACDVSDAVAEIEREINNHPAPPMNFDLTNAHGVVGLALYEVARRLEHQAPNAVRLIRVDWSERLIRPLSPDTAPTTALDVALGVAEYLQLYGKRMLGTERSRGSVPSFGDAGRLIARNIAAARPILEAAHHGEWDRPLRIRGNHTSDRLVRDLVERDLLRRQGSQVWCTSLRAFQYLHGRWLEEYLFDIADASGEFDDCASGVRFGWGGGPEGVTNEIDFVGTAHGRATIASCKTGFRELNGPLYELLTLAERAAGRSVVSVFATSETLDRPERQRAAALGVRVLDARRLGDPEFVLAALLGGTRERPNAAAMHP